MVHRIWQEDGLALRRFHQLGLSNGPTFATKVDNVIGLDVDPLRPADEDGRLSKSARSEAREAAHAVVLSIRREVAGPGAGSSPTGPADAARASRGDDP